MEFTLAIASLVMGGGWLFTYRAFKRKNDGEAAQAEADGWKAQQDVYQQTIADLKESCEYIRQDRNLLREENRKLLLENSHLREKINDMERQISELKEAIARQGRKIEALDDGKKRNGKAKARTNSLDANIEPIDSDAL